MKKNIPLFFLLFFSFTASTAQAITTFKIATLSPDGSAWMKQMRAGAAEISKKTENRVNFKFYPGGVMGDDKAVLKKIRIGQLQGGAVMAGSLAKVYKDSQIYNTPLIFKNFAEVDYVRSKMDSKIINGFEKGGFVSFGLAEGGFAYAMSTSQLTSPEQLTKNKVWAPSDDNASLEIVRAYDITPIALSLTDVLAGLQTGIIDTVATSPIGAIALQWHTQVKYITDIPLSYVYALFIIEKKSFSKLSTQDQAIVHQVMTEKFKAIDQQNRKDNIAALKALQNQGITLMKPSNAELITWNSKAEVARKRLLESGEISNETMNELLKHLQSYRSQQAGSK
jgi:TRAP-type C4-dicarboxylate transport system substrate-binding protein